MGTRRESLLGPGRDYVGVELNREYITLARREESSEKPTHTLRLAPVALG
jgi:hypothetical protein